MSTRLLRPNCVTALAAARRRRALRRVEVVFVACGASNCGGRTIDTSVSPEVSETEMGGRAPSGNGGQLRIPGGGGEGTGGGLDRGGVGGEATATWCGVLGLIAYYPFDHDTTDHAADHDIIATSTSSIRGVALRRRHRRGGDLGSP